jgi:hypothetical protein
MDIFDLKIIVAVVSNYLFFSLINVRISNLRELT